MTIDESGISVITRIGIQIATMWLMAWSPALVAGDDADLIFSNGVVRVMNAARDVESAVAIKQGLIVAVGTDSEIDAHRGAATLVIDMQGQSLFPGFTDAHVHPADGGATLLELAFSDQDGAAEIQQKIRSHQRDNPGIKVITGSGWSLTKFAGGNPHKSILDAVVSDRAVVLTDSNHHSVWLNSFALDQAGITRDTVDPVNGKIERDATGAPTGTLRESAQDLVKSILPAVALDTRLARLRAGIEHLNALGYTALLDASVDPAQDNAWFALAGELSIQAHLALLPESLPTGMTASVTTIAAVMSELTTRRQKFAGTGINAATVKIFQDGGLESCTAAFLKPYADAGCSHGHVGAMNYPAAFLAPYMNALVQEGFRAHVHAIGDRTIRETLNAIGKVARSSDDSRLPHAIAHLQFVHPEDHARFSALNVAAVIQALWAFPYDNSMKPFAGSEIGPWRYPFRSLADANALLVSGSDWPVSTANPFYALEVAVRRQDEALPDGEKLLPEQALSVDQFMAALTVNGARYLGEEFSRGTIEPGKSADLVLVSKDPYRIDPTELSEIETVMTIYQGRIVYPAH